MSLRALLAATSTLSALLFGHASQAMMQGTPAISVLFKISGRVVVVRVDKSEALGDCGTRQTTLAAMKPAEQSRSGLGWLG